MSHGSRQLAEWAADQQVEVGAQQRERVDLEPAFVHGLGEQLLEARHVESVLEERAATYGPVHHVMPATGLVHPMSKGHSRSGTGWLQSHQNSRAYCTR